MNISHDKSDYHNLVKVSFNLEKSDCYNYQTESMWAEQRENNLYVIKNIPFYAHGVSFNDIVDTKYVEGELLIKSVHRHSGHSTYRIFFLEEIATKNAFKEYWGKLERLGCSYEGATKHLFAVDVPPKTDIYEVYSILEEGEENKVWDFEEAYCAHVDK